MIEQMVLLGASGDLTSRLPLPAVAQLAEAGLLPPGFTTEDFRLHIATELEKYPPVAAVTRDAVVRMELNELRIHLPRPTLSRIDHFLCNELTHEIPENDPRSSIRRDGAEASWRVVDPVTTTWAAGDVPMQEYPAGGTPPGQSDGNGAKPC